MRSGEIVALFLLVGAVGVGYLVYTKKIKLPELEALGLDEFLGGGKKEDEEKSIVKGLEEDTSSESESESRSPSLSTKDLEKFISDPFKEGQRILNKIAPKKPSIIPIQKKERSLDELIADAFKTDDGKFPCGSPQRPYC